MKVPSSLNAIPVIAGLMLLVPSLLIVGCKPTSHDDTGKSTTSAAQSGDGSSVFSANCAKCHSINGTGAKRAPDLSHVASNSDHTAQWLSQFIKNPKSKDPGSRMPPFEGKISDGDLKTLTDYLSSLK